MILKYFSDNLCPGSTFAAYSPPINMQGASHLINPGLHRMKRKLIGNFFRVVWNTWHICLFVRLKKVPSFLCLSSSSNNPTCFAKKPFAFLSSPACILQVCSIQILKKVSYDCYSCLADYDDLKKTLTHRMTAATNHESIFYFGSFLHWHSRFFFSTVGSKDRPKAQYFSL